MEALNEPMLLRIPEVARLLGLSRPGVYKLLSKGELPVVRFGKSVRIPAHGLKAWVKARTLPAQERIRSEQVEGEVHAV